MAPATTPPQGHLPVEILVDGEVQVLGTEADPVVIAPDGLGVAFPGAWGGFRFRRGSSGTFAHVQTSGALRFVQGEYVPQDATSAPTVSLTDIVVSDTDRLVSGVCPAVLERITGTRLASVVSLAACARSVTYRDIEVSSVGTNVGGVLFSFLDYEAGGPETMSLTLERVTARGRAGRSDDFLRTGFFSSGSLFFASRMTVVTLREVSVEAFRSVMDLTLQAQSQRQEVHVLDSTAENVDFLLDGASLNSIDRIVLDGLQVRDAESLFATTNLGSSITVVRSHFQDFTDPVFDLFVGDNVELAINDTRFRGAPKGVRMNLSGTTAIDLQRCHFEDVPLAIELTGVSASERADINASNGFWADVDGVPLSSGDIEASIVDPQVDLGVDFKGRTRFAPVASAPFLPDPT